MEGQKDKTEASIFRGIIEISVFVSNNCNYALRFDSFMSHFGLNINHIFRCSTAIVTLVPSCKTNIAKLVATSTDYVIAAVYFLNENLTAGTSFELFEDILEVV